MGDAKIVIGFERKGSGFLLQGINEGIVRRLQRAFNCQVAIESSKKKPRFVNGVINMEVPIILKNVENVALHDVERVLSGLLDGYDEYNNLRVRMIE